MASRNERNARYSHGSRTSRYVARGGIRRDSRDPAHREERRRNEINHLRRENEELRRSLARCQETIQRYEDEAATRRHHRSSPDRELRSAKRSLRSKSRELTMLRDTLAATKPKQRELEAAAKAKQLEFVAAAEDRQNAFEAAVKERLEHLEATVATAHCDRERMRNHLLAKREEAIGLNEELVATREKHANRATKLRKRFRDAQDSVEDNEDKRRLIRCGCLVPDTVRGTFDRHEFRIVNMLTGALWETQCKPEERPRSSIRTWCSNQELEDDLYSVYNFGMDLKRRGEDHTIIAEVLVRAIGKCRENDIVVPRHIYRMFLDVVETPGSVGILEERLSVTPEPPSPRAESR